MPDFDKLHELSAELAQLTKPGGEDRQEGLMMWAMAVGAIWGQIAEMWGGEK